jgi:hypothetical protein
VKFLHIKLLIGVLCVKGPLPPVPSRVRRPFVVILLLVMPLAWLGAYDICISVVRSYMESGCVSTKKKFSV